MNVLGRTQMLRIFSLAAAAAVAMTGAVSAQTAPWKPDKVIRAVVPFGAGSATDGIARIVLDEVGKQLGQSIVVENRVGASGTIGANAVAKADPDGYTILVAASSHTVTPSTFAQLPYDAANDFTAVTPLVSIPNVIVVNAKRDYKTAKDLADDGKKRDGKLNYASAGAGSATHLAAERFRLAGGFTAQHVPFKGSSEAITEILSDRIDFYASPINAAAPLIRDGKLRALAVSSKQRASALPDVPTTVQAGFPNSDYEFWVGVLLPKNTPKPIVDAFHSAINKATAEPALAKKLAELGADPMKMSPAEFDAMLRSEIKSNADVVKAAGIKVN
jgi:tripartite-type tricarboxylate transporter receptor subunit TctC